MQGSFIFTRIFKKLNIRKRIRISFTDSEALWSILNPIKAKNEDVKA